MGRRDSNPQPPESRFALLLDCFSFFVKTPLPFEKGFREPLSTKRLENIVINPSKSL